MQGETGKYAEGLTVRKAEFLDPEGNVSFLLEYREPIPFFPILSQGITIKTAVKKRAWIGIEGKVGRTERDEALGMEDADEQMVYVGSGMGRYHLSRGLPLFIEPVSNDDGVPGGNGAERFGEKADALRFL